MDVFPALLLLLSIWALADKHFESGWFRDHGDLVQSIRDPNNRDGLHSSWLGNHRQVQQVRQVHVWVQVNMRFSFVTIDNFQLALLQYLLSTYLPSERIHVILKPWLVALILRVPGVRTAVSFHLTHTLSCVYLLSSGAM